MEMSSSNKPAINDYQTGGTLVGLRGKHMGRILQANNDQHRMERWGYVCLTGEGRKVYVALAYHVAQEEIDGIHTVYIQQYRLMQSKEIEKPTPRKRWCNDLAKEINTWKKDGKLLLLTDANSALNDSDFAKFMTEVGLFDIM
eukprot:10633795-Ditylum_brightwellii.AAC.1